MKKNCKDPCINTRARGVNMRMYVLLCARTSAPCVRACVHRFYEFFGGKYTWQKPCLPFCRSFKVIYHRISSSQPWQMDFLSTEILLLYKISAQRMNFQNLDFAILVIANILNNNLLYLFQFQPKNWLSKGL